VMIALAKQYGIDAAFIEGAPKLIGVWVDETSPSLWPGDPRLEGGAGRAAKIGAIGVRLSRWVTMHGFAFNISTDLSAFRWIIPCGITEYGVTSVAQLGIGPPTVDRAAVEAIRHFEEVFEAEGTMTPVPSFFAGDGIAHEDAGALESNPAD
jgi:lipoyl(octanoyl) transferase